MSIALHYSFRTLDHQQLFESENIQEKHVEQVYLKFCDLQRFPEWLLNLQNLTHINIASNVIEEIPESIQRLSCLNYFDASDNRLSSLSSGLFNLTQLRYLDVAGNFIEKIPKEIGNLLNLELLNFGRNFLTEVPNELTSCTSLVQISFDDCSRLFSIPINLLSLPSLVNVSFENCNLITIPAMISPSVKCLRINGNFLLNCVPHEVLNYLGPGLSTSEFYLIDDEDISQMSKAQINFIKNSLDIKHVSLLNNRIANLPQQLEKAFPKSSFEVCSLRELCLRKTIADQSQLPRELRTILNSPTAICQCRSKIFAEAFVLIFFDSRRQDFDVAVSKLCCSKNCSTLFYEENKSKYLFMT